MLTGAARAVLVFLREPPRHDLRDSPSHRKPLLSLSRTIARDYAGFAPASGCLAGQSPASGAARPGSSLGAAPDFVKEILWASGPKKITIALTMNTAVIRPPIACV